MCTTHRLLITSCNLDAINPAGEGAEAAGPQFCTCGDHTKVAVTGTGAVIGLAAAPAAAPGVLALLGFGSEGIIASALIRTICCPPTDNDFILCVASWAAAVQASIGNVVAGSPFAVATSVGAGGALPVVGFIISAAGGMAIAGLGYAVYKACKTRPIVCPTCGLPKSS